VITRQRRRAETAIAGQIVTIASGQAAATVGTVNAATGEVIASFPVCGTGVPWLRIETSVTSSDSARLDGSVRPWFS